MKALIVGGGIAGPVAALALRKAGIDSTVFESHASTADGVGGVLMVAPNGLNALRIIGANAVVRAIGQPVRRMAMADGSGKRFGEFAGLPGLPDSLVMWRADLNRVLHDLAVARGIRVEYGKRLVDVVESRTGISAHFTDGSTESADVLIGADGIRSTVRTLIDSDAPGPQYIGLLGFGGYAVDSGVEVQPDTMHFVFGKRAFLGYWMGPDGRILWFGNLPRKESMTMAQARRVRASDWLQALRDAYADDTPGQDLLAHTSAEQLFVAGAGETLPPVPHWYRDRMVLVGDAAHAPSSSSGQGASLGVESAIQLARCLRDLPSAPAAFAAYEQLRRPRVEKVAADAAKTNSNKAAGPVGKALMRALMPIAMKTFFKPEKMFGALHGYRIDWDEIVTA